MKSNKSLIIIIIVLLISLLSSLFLVFRTTIFVNKAATSNTSVIVLENSYLFASPLQAKADSKEQIRITVFILDGRGLGVSNQNVTLNLPSTILVNKIQSITDDTGKAVFDLSSAYSGQYNISATVNSNSVPQKVKITFY